MKKYLAIVLLSGSFLWSGCGDDRDNFVVTNGQQQQVVIPATNGFFVDAATGNDATGSFTGGRPFATVQGAIAAAPTNSTIVVRSGSFVGTVNLKNGQRLLGSGSSLLQAQGAVRPVFTGPIVLADGNTVDFVRVAGTNGDAIDADGQNGGRITNCELVNSLEGSLGRGVSGEGITGTWDVSDNIINAMDGIGIDLRTSGTGEAVAFVDENSISNGDSSAVGLVSGGSSDFAVSVVGNSFSGNGTEIGDTFELICGENSTMCLDLENNTNDGTYVVGLFDDAALQIEEFTTLVSPQPAGAGNTGALQDDSDFEITSVSDGFCGFN